MSATATDRIRGAGHSDDLSILVLLRDRPHPTDYLAVAAKTQGIEVYESNIYQVLERLLDRDLVTRHWATGGNGLPQRVYALTDAGRARLAALQPRLA